ncbi:hypothetical protein, partial [Moorena bouillonii]|uniref:hypothetical protein n=1 Tax=Moorena bouillonii TaxID=207920 RepID=UPI001BDF87BA
SCRSREQGTGNREQWTRIVRVAWPTARETLSEKYFYKRSNKHFGKGSREQGKEAVFRKFY